MSTIGVELECTFGHEVTSATNRQIIPKIRVPIATTQSTKYRNRRFSPLSVRTQCDKNTFMIIWTQSASQHLWSQLFIAFFFNNKLITRSVLSIKARICLLFVWVWVKTLKITLLMLAYASHWLDPVFWIKKKKKSFLYFRTHLIQEIPSFLLNLFQ